MHMPPHPIDIVDECLLREINFYDIHKTNEQASEKERERGRTKRSAWLCARKYELLKIKQ